MTTATTPQGARPSATSRLSSQPSAAVQATGPEESSQAALDIDRILDDVFITPKVLDRRVFEDMANVLRQLIREAAAKGESLRASAAEVRAMGENLREVTRQLQARLEAALKVAPALDQRVFKAEQVVQLAIDRSALTKQLESSISQIIETRLAEYSRKLDELGQNQVESLRAAAGRLTEDLSAHRTRLSNDAMEASSRCEEARGRLQTELDSFHQMVRSQVDAAAERLAEPIRTADRKATEVASRLDADIETAEDRLRVAREQADVKVAGLVETISRHADAVIRKAQEAASTTDLQLRDLIDQATSRAEAIGLHIEQKCAQAVASIEESSREMGEAFRDELLSARQAAVTDASEHLAQTVRTIEQGVASQISDIVASRASELDSALNARMAAFNTHAAEAAQTVQSAGEDAAQAAITAGSKIAAQLVDLGTSSLTAMKEAQTNVRDVAATSIAAIRKQAVDVQNQIEPARELLESLPAAVNQQLSAFQSRLAEMIAPTTRKLEQLCTATAGRAALSEGNNPQQGSAG